MYPSGHMSGSYYDPYAGNYGAGYTMPCCGGHGYNYCYPPGLVTPYPHLYSAPHSCVAQHPVSLPYHHHHPQYNHSLSGIPAPANSYAPSEACLPIQQQQPMWRPMVVPPSNCCCGHPNHVSYYGNPWSGGLSNDAKVTNEPDSEDVKKVGGVRPVLLTDGSKASQPQLYWIPQHFSNLQQQGAEKEPQDGKSRGQLIPFDLDKLASFHNKDGNKALTAGARKDFPFPIILMPSDSGNSGESTVKNRISEIEEKPSSCANTGPLKLLDNVDVERTVPPEPVKTPETRNDAVSRGIPSQNGKVRLKDIPVKQAGESTEKKQSTNAAVKSQTRSVSPTKTSKLPPVCLRVDPLPRKRNGNGTPKPPSSSSSHIVTQQHAQTGSTSEDTNSKKKEVKEAKTSHHNSDDSINVKVVEAAAGNISNNNPISDETETVKNGRGNGNEGEIMESKKSAQPKTPERFGEGHAHDVKPGDSVSEETAAVRIQSAYRGYEERKWHSLQKLRQIAKIRDQIFSIKDRVAKIESADMNKEEFERQKLVLGETIMSHLLTLDTIQGLHPSIRDVRKSVARELISLQEKLDLLHAQRFREGRDVMNHGQGNTVDNNEVKDMPCMKTEEPDLIDVKNVGNQQENKQSESHKKNMNTLDCSVDKSENLMGNKCAGLHQKETPAGNTHAEDTQVGNLPMGDSPQEGKSLLNHDAGNQDDLKLVSSPNEVEGIGEEITEGITLEEQSFEGGDKGYVAKTVSEHALTANSDVVAIDSHTVESIQAAAEREEPNSFSCGSTAEIGEVISGELAAVEVSKSDDEPTVEVCSESETIDHVEKQTKQLALGSEAENVDKQEPIATNTCESEVLQKVEEVNKFEPSLVISDDKPEIASEVHACEDDSTKEITSQESITTCSYSKKLETPTDEDGISINEHETPHFSNISQTSTDDANTVGLAEENEKLRETVRKLLQSEKDQLAAISTLSGRLRNLEKQLKKKRNNKIKLHKSSNKNHESFEGSIPICSI